MAGTWKQIVYEEIHDSNDATTFITQDVGECTGFQYIDNDGNWQNQVLALNDGSIGENSATLSAPPDDGFQFWEFGPGGDTDSANKLINVGAAPAIREGFSALQFVHVTGVDEGFDANANDVGGISYGFAGDDDDAAINGSENIGTNGLESFATIANHNHTGKWDRDQGDSWSFGYKATFWQDPGDQTDETGAVVMQWQQTVSNIATFKLPESATLKNGKNESIQRVFSSRQSGDLVVEVTVDGGTNWTELTMTNYDTYGPYLRFDVTSAPFSNGYTFDDATDDRIKLKGNWKESLYGTGMGSGTFANDDYSNVNQLYPQADHWGSDAANLTVSETASVSLSGAIVNIDGDFTETGIADLDNDWGWSNSAISLTTTTADRTVGSGDGDANTTPLKLGNSGLMSIVIDDSTTVDAGTIIDSVPYEASKTSNGGVAMGILVNGNAGASLFSMDGCSYALHKPKDSMDGTNDGKLDMVSKSFIRCTTSAADVDTKDKMACGTMDIDASGNIAIKVGV